MFSDRLLSLLAEQGDAPDYPRLAADVLGIRGAPPALARTLVEQAILLTDWREHWRQVGERATQTAPHAPGVYRFLDATGRVLYVGKAANLRRRLAAHFADRKWKALPPALARVVTVECDVLGSEIEALLREAALIRELRPAVNIQTAAPSLETRAIAQALVRDIVLILPSVHSDAAEIVAARTDGATLLRRIRRSGGDAGTLAGDLWAFFSRTADVANDGLAPLVFSWLAGRGHRTTRLDPHDFTSAPELGLRLDQLLADRDLFTERVVAL
jgi:hypothetical protein